MAVRVDDRERRIELAVGDLVPAGEGDPFAARSFVSRMLAGIEAHLEHHRLSRDEDPSYRAEVFLRGEFEVDNWTVALSGRADGIREEGGTTVVEEVKTVVLPVEAFAAAGPERWPGFAIQLGAYLWLAAREGLAVRGRLVLVNLPGGERRALDVPFDPAEVEARLAGRVRSLLAEWDQDSRRLAARRALGAALVFPFPRRRPHQEDMERLCREAFDAGECLLVSAPPGLGKTAAALSAALGHALAHDRRVFFATAKTTEQRIVTGTLARFAAAHPGLTAVQVRAKAKICTNEVVFCHGDFCEFARDWPAKVQALRPREALLARGLVLPDAVREEGLRTRACPFELEIDLARRADVVVGDFNYVFDPAVALRPDPEIEPSDDLVLVVDEAHNLVDRARDCFSPALAERPFNELLAWADLRPGELWRRLERWLLSVLKLFQAAREEAAEAGEAALLLDPAGGPGAYRLERRAAAIAERRAGLEELLLDYFAWRRDMGSVDPDDPVLALAFEFFRFARVAPFEGDEFVWLYEPGGDGPARLRILCLDPSGPLGRRLASFHAVVAMSATLEPAAYHRDLLGFPRHRTRSLVFGSPFPRENRLVAVVPTVETTFRRRDRWYGRVADTIAEVVTARPGHWAAFLPSFAYLREIEARLAALPGERLVQSPDLDDAARGAILSRLEKPDGAPRLLLAVLGGGFAEGVDLPGEALIGIVVVSPGLPQVSLDRELLRQFLDERNGRGFEWAYLVPGMSKVVQAAGRLVRSEQDRGAIVLLDRRFAESGYARLLPRDWYEREPGELVCRDPAGAVRRFFGAARGGEGDPPRS